MVHIRFREDGDLPACADVLRAVYEVDGYPVGGVDNPIPFLHTDDMAWVAVNDQDGSGDGARVVGHIALKKATEDDVAVALWRRKHPHSDAEPVVKDILVLGRLFVHPTARKGGAARKLIQAAVDEGARRGQRLVMFGLIKDQEAIRLYRSLGWEYYGTTVFRWGQTQQMDAECFASPMQPP